MYHFSVEVAQGNIISLVASNSQGRTKKIFINAVTLFGFALGNIGPKSQGNLEERGQVESRMGCWQCRARGPLGCIVRGTYRALCFVPD